MILVREVFRIAPEGMREARELAIEGKALMEKAGMKGLRAMTDLTGEYYTLVLESVHEDLAAFEKMFNESMPDPEFQAWYPKLRRHVRGGRREVYTIFE